MIKKLTTILFILILICSCGADINDADKRNENWIYWVDAKTGEASWVPVGNETTIKNGKYISFYSKGTIYQKGKLKNGKRIDTIYCYDINEKLIKLRFVKADTILEYYVKDGPYTAYFQNGEIFEKGTVKNHKHGVEWIRYYENGKEEWNERFKDDNGLTLWYYEDGQISDSTNFINRKAEGKVKKWHQNGKIEEISYWKNGMRNGSSESFYENGILKLRTNWTAGKHDGKYESWYENGKKEQICFYKDGLQDGRLQQWYSNGNTQGILNYNLGKINGKVISFYENGKIQGEGFYKEGKRNGVFIKYDKTGKFIQKQNQIDGQAVSE